jgi:hypothetical protein
MRTISTAIVAVALAALLGASTASAVDVLGGGSKKSDCYNGLTVTANGPILKQSAKVVQAGACGGSCTFTVNACVGMADTSGKCTAAALSSLAITPASIPAPATLGPENACGASTDIVVPLNGKKQAKSKIKLVGAAASAKPKKDPDKITLKCKENADANCDGNTGGCPTTCDNTAGGPDRLVMTIVDNGTDLDNGWSGNSHNFPLVPNGKIDVCLSECDSAGDTECTVCGAVGAGTGSGVQFGAPLPLFASNVPVCVVSRWREPIRGTVDEATGATSIDIKLFSDVYLTDQNSVCPQCKNGQCNSGVRAGQSCTVEATIPVFVSQQRTDNYELSSQCVPSSPTATLNIDFLPLTSGAADPLVGPTPCTRLPGDPIGVPVKPDDCGAAGCGSQCTGLACVEQVPDPTNPGSMICRDSKGGLSQLCCNNNTNRPCHTLANGGTLTRTGNITAPAPALPDATYPKTNAGVLAATFCIPATGTNTIDSVTGLPGPGAILLNGTGAWTKN